MKRPEMSIVDAMDGHDWTDGRAVGSSVLNKFIEGNCVRWLNSGVCIAHPPERGFAREHVDNIHSIAIDMLEMRETATL